MVIILLRHTNFWKSGEPESSQIVPENVDLIESFVDAFDDANLDDESSSETECSPADVTASRSFPKIRSKISNFFSKK